MQNTSKSSLKRCLFPGEITGWKIRRGLSCISQPVTGQTGDILIRSAPNKELALDRGTDPFCALSNREMDEMRFSGTEVPGVQKSSDYI